jgi:hypothetical protein
MIPVTVTRRPHQSNQPRQSDASKRSMTLQEKCHTAGQSSHHG